MIEFLSTCHDLFVINQFVRDQCGGFTFMPEKRTPVVNWRTGAFEQGKDIRIPNYFSF